MENLALEQSTTYQHVSARSEADPRLLLYPATQLTAEFGRIIYEFWRLSPKLRLFSISQNPHYYWHMQDFYVAQKGLDKEGRRWAQLRISEGLCQQLFESTLGKTPEEPEFTLASIRSFEVFLLEQFSRKLFQTISPALLKRPSNDYSPNDADPMVHLVWVLDGEPEQYNQIIFTAPLSCLKTRFNKPEPAVWQLSRQALLHAHSPVTLRLGTTHARLEDLQQLERDDVIIFENSSIHQWHLLDRTTGKYLRVPIHVPEHRINQVLPPTQGNDSMPNDTEMKQNIWDNLEVEVAAAFNPIKLPLKRLKEIEEGLVLEVGDLMDNRVKIEVEGHAVAWGELLVLGDKFGVRIQGVMEESSAAMETSVPMASLPPAAPALEDESPEMETEDEELGEDFETEDGDEEEGGEDFEMDETDFDDLDDEDDWS